MSRFLTLIFAFSVLIPLFAQNVKLTDFGRPENVAKWQCRPGATFTHSGWPDNHPGGCAKLVFQKNKPGLDEWPAAMLRWDNIKPSDWRMAEELRFNVFAPENGKFVLHLVGNGGQRKNFTVTLEKGRNSCRIKLGKLFFAAHIAQIHLFTFKPEKEKTFYVGDLELFMRDMSVLTNRLEKLRKTDVPFSPAVKKMFNECDELLVSINKNASNANYDRIADISKLEDLLGTLTYQVQHNLIAHRHPAASPLLAVWASPMEKIHRERQVFLNLPASNAVLDAARNEGEGIQLALYPRRNFKSVSVSIANPPKDRAGNLFPLKSVSVHPVGYLNCAPPAYDVSRSGWWPDPILEYAKALPLESGKWQPWWLEIQVPENQRPGWYDGELLVKADEIQQKIPFRIHVRNFALPSGVPYPMATALGSYILNPKQASAAEKKKWKYAAFDLFLKHRVNPDALYQYEPQDVEEVVYKISRGARIFNIMHVDGKYDEANKFNPERKKWIFEKLDRAIQEYRKAGVYRNAFLYGYDEAQSDAWDSIRHITGELKKKYPDLPYATTSYDHSCGSKSKLDGLVDIWSPQTPEFEKNLDAVRAAQKRGTKVWWYIACTPFAPYANFFLEYPAADARLLMGMMYWKYRPDGFLYYCLGNWYRPELKDGRWINFGNAAAQPPMTGAPLTNWTGYSWCNFNGDGNLYYASKEGPIPGIRLKNIRDGLDDYLYLEQLDGALKNSSGMSVKWKKDAENALRIDSSLVNSMTVFTKDPAAIAARRTMISDLLEEYQNKKQQRKGF